VGERSAGDLDDRRAAAGEVGMQGMVGRGALGGEDHVQPDQLGGVLAAASQLDQPPEQLDALRNRVTQLARGVVVAPGEHRLEQVFLAREVME
jgi:hypothetical protein